MTQAVQPSYQSAIAADWLAEQIAQQRELLLVVDRLAEPDPIVELFGADLMQNYINLYQGTELDDMADAGPWLVRVNHPDAAFLHTLLDDPKRNWGWLASAEHIDLRVLAQHWRERMLINEQEQRALYRFQDNRVIAHHLHGIEEIQRPLLLGPLSSALWDGDAWARFDNPVPAHGPPPFATPWLDLPEPPTTARQIRHHNLLQWLWQQFPTATAQLAEHILLDDWLDDQLDQAEHWQWHAPEQQRFLLQYRMVPVLASHSFWAAHTAESPEQHFLRCQATVANMEHTYP